MIYVADLIAAAVAQVVDAVWRAICHHLTYMPEKIGSKWLTELSVSSGRVWYSPQASMSVDELDFAIPALLKRIGA